MNDLDYHEDNCPQSTIPALAERIGAAAGVDVDDDMADALTCLTLLGVVRPRCMGSRRAPWADRWTTYPWTTWRSRGRPSGGSGGAVSTAVADGSRARPVERGAKRLGRRSTDRLENGRWRPSTVRAPGALPAPCLC